MIRRLLISLLLMAAGAAGQATATTQRAPTIAAASDLRFALESVSRTFTTQSGERVELVFGSSGNLARQLMEGAPFDMFLSADETFVERLVDAGLTRDRGVLYAKGRLVIFAPRGSPLPVDERLDGLRMLLARGGVPRFAIANPEHAPYGRAAEAALRARGLWEGVQPALVLGENITQAAQFATTGDAIGGLLAYSLVLVPPLNEQGKYALVAESLHPALRQRMVLLKRAGPTAERFYQYLQQAPSRQIFQRYGFAVPND